jgi:hypothetical protein
MLLSLSEIILPSSLFLFEFFSLFNELKDRFEPRLRGRGKGTLDLIKGIMLIQEFRYLDPELPTGDYSSAGKVFVDGPAISKRNFSSQLRASNDQGIMFFNHGCFGRALRIWYEHIQ